MIKNPIISPSIRLNFETKLFQRSKSSVSRALFSNKALQNKPIAILVRIVQLTWLATRLQLSIRNWTLAKPRLTELAWKLGRVDCCHQSVYSEHRREYQSKLSTWLLVEWAMIGSKLLRFSSLRCPEIATSSKWALLHIMQVLFEHYICLFHYLLCRNLAKFIIFGQFLH